MEYLEKSTVFALICVTTCLLLVVSDDGQPELSSQEVVAALSGMEPSVRECVANRLHTDAQRGTAPKQPAIDRFQARCKRADDAGSKKRAAMQTVDEAMQSLRTLEGAAAEKGAP